jgi:hypothetical protein
LADVKLAFTYSILKLGAFTPIPYRVSPTLVSRSPRIARFPKPLIKAEVNSIGINAAGAIIAINMRNCKLFILNDETISFDNCYLPVLIITPKNIRNAPEDDRAGVFYI